MLIKTLTALALFTLTFFSLPTHADEVEADPLAGIQMSKSDVMQGLEMLKKEGKISNDDYVKAQKQLAGMSDSAISGMKDQAVAIIRKDPDKAVELYKAPKVDPNEVQKQLNSAGIK
jgi:hypothetical protein